MLKTKINVDKDFLNYYNNLEQNISNESFEMAKSSLNNMERIFKKYNNIRLDMLNADTISNSSYDYEPIDNQINYMQKACIESYKQIILNNI